MHNFRELKVWHKARSLVLDMYQLTSSLPEEERYGLQGQIRRSVVSIPSNIAEGCGRGSDPQLIHYLNLANGSSCELETQLYLCIDLNFLSMEDCSNLISKIHEIQKMIAGLKNSLNT